MPLAWLLLTATMASNPTEMDLHRPHSFSQLREPTALGAPYFTQYTDMTVGAGLTATQTVWAIDPDVDNLTFFKVSGPDYLTVQTMNSYGSYAYAEVTVHPGVEEAGVTTGVLGVSDGTSTTTVEITITVLAACPVTDAQAMPLPWTPRSSLVGDVDGDGHADLVTFSGYTLDAAVLRGNGDGTFDAPGYFTQVGNGSQSLLADFNHDGRDDHVFTAIYSTRISLGQPDGTFGSALDMPHDGSFQTPSALTSVDVNGDGDRDVVLAYPGSTPHLRVLLGDGTGSFSVGSSTDVPSPAYGTLATGDFDGDGHQDLALGQYYLDQLQILLGDGVGGFQSWVSYPVHGYGTHAVAVGDLNGDTWPDLAVARDGLSVLFNDGSGHFSTAQDLSPPYRFWSVAIGDVTDDGVPDLVATGEEWFGQTNGAALVFAGTGSSIGSFSGIVLGNRIDGVFLRDFDEDGLLDWAATDPDQSLLVFLNQGCAGDCNAVDVSFTLSPSALNIQSLGRWVTATIEPVPPTSPADIAIDDLLLNGIVPVDPSAPVSVGDVDGDGRPDLTVKFSRAALELSVDEGEAVPVRIEGRIGRECFEATCTIRVIRGRVVSPMAGSVFNPGSALELRWDAVVEVQAATVSIMWSRDGGRSWLPYACNVANRGTYSLTVPNTPTQDARVVVLVESRDATGAGVSNVLGISPRFEITAAPLAVGEAGASFALHGAQPNPGRGLTVSFSLRDAAPARLAVYDIGGREVVRRDIGAMGAGRHTVVLARSGALSPGIYLIRLTQSGRERVARAIVTR